MLSGKLNPRTAIAPRRRLWAASKGNRIETPERRQTIAPDVTRRLLHGLRVRQAELKQNEELRDAQLALDDERTRYFDLYDLAPVGYCTLSDQGLILEVNLTAAKLLSMARSDLIRQPLSRFIVHEDQDIFYLYRKELLESGKVVPVIDGCYPLSKVAEAFWYFEKVHPRGKIVIRVV